MSRCVGACYRESVLMRREDLMSWSTHNTASELLALAATVKGERHRHGARICKAGEEKSLFLATGLPGQWMEDSLE